MALISDNTSLYKNGEVLTGTDELLQAQAQLWNHIFAFAKSMCLKCAIELNIPDIIHNHGKPMSLSQLTEALKLDDKAKSQSLSRIMRMLVHSKIFTQISQLKDVKDEEHYYSLSPVSRLLLKDKPMSLFPVAMLVLDPTLKKPWHHMSEYLIGDNTQSPYEAAHGQHIWEHLGEDSKLNQLFNDATASDSSLLGQVLIKNHAERFEGVERLVDIGGGTGKIAKTIVDAFPSVRCVVLDLPHVVDGLDVNSNANPRFVGGDMFEMIPPADVLLLKWILHDWNDEACVKILKNCKEALAQNKNGGKLMIIDMIMDVHKNGDMDYEENQLYMDMVVMTYYGSKERTKKEWAKLFSDAGFTNYNIIPCAFGATSLIEVYP